MVRIGVVGCAHGALDAIYAFALEHNAEHPSEPIELILCCGDFECIRNESDLQCKASPPRYRHMNNFHEYYRGVKTAPILTIFVGGNHEASNYLQELFYGGWVAPNIFYLGAAGVVNVGGLRIAGLSGIYDKGRYHLGHFEVAPYSKKTISSVYYVREVEVFELSHMSNVPIDISMTHDWPRKIEDHGDLDALLRQRPDFKTSIDADAFGSPASEFLLSKLRPRFWFAGHMHVNFEATVAHATDDTTTKFFGVSKCFRTTACMEIIDVPARPEVSNASTQPAKIMVDRQWLTVLLATHSLSSMSKDHVRLPTKPIVLHREDFAWVDQQLEEFYTKHHDNKTHGEWITDFEMTALPHGEADLSNPQFDIGNPQTDTLLELLKLDHIVTRPSGDEAALVDFEI
ncbi:TPA: hypothetical protein N0F65_011679 [Lagenidium giganteum]|uniref:Lariat debranching enzyme C-terminal domain-containing protein n=1 Tax=Lagenidium giganteum TaxID=4803 RepID=A0AAV2ZFY8_9STRA|nr:TPA: hypothetical protein N0F65_011679 [Lagenidium giganteum]